MSERKGSRNSKIIRAKSGAISSHQCLRGETKGGGGALARNWESLAPDKGPED